MTIRGYENVIIKLFLLCAFIFQYSMEFILNTDSSIFKVENAVDLVLFLTPPQKKQKLKQTKN